MTSSRSDGFPGGSRSRVTRAGSRIRNDEANPDDLRVIEEWRAAHRPVLNTFQAILRTRTRNKKIVVAQRHKRRSTIFGKLDRFPHMQLARMDDVAGCRLIFSSINGLYAFRENFHKARFKHKRRNETDKYDYIKSPKASGYRGVHDVYSYDVNSEAGKHLEGLLVEVQYRTKVQHAWATAVEVLGFITSSQPKFDAGDRRYVDGMALASEILARTFENSKGPFPDKLSKSLVTEFLALDRKLGLLNMLRGLNASRGIGDARRNVILIVPKLGKLEVRTFRDAPEALRQLFELEKTMPGSDIVLVRAETDRDVREAFKNYFSDATDFIRLIDEGCQKLSGRRVLTRPTRPTRPKRPTRARKRK